MADRDKPKDEGNATLPPPVLTPDQVRAVSELARQIVRAEIAAAEAMKPKAQAVSQVQWKHDADHGSIQTRRDAQRRRDEDAGLNAEA